MQLKPLPDHRDCQGDYVNASYVDVSLSLIFNLNTSHSLSSIAGIYIVCQTSFLQHKVHHQFIHTYLAYTGNHKHTCVYYTHPHKTDTHPIHTLIYTEVCNRHYTNIVSQVPYRRLWLISGGWSGKRGHPP